jgi:hypothetical protein
MSSSRVLLNGHSCPWQFTTDNRVHFPFPVNALQSENPRKSLNLYLDILLLPSNAAKTSVYNILSNKKSPM